MGKIAEISIFVRLYCPFFMGGKIARIHAVVIFTEFYIINLLLDSLEYRFLGYFLASLVL